MRSIGIILLLLISSFSAIGQQKRHLQISVLPENPTTQDSIKVAIGIGYTSSRSYGFTFLQKTDTFKITHCLGTLPMLGYFYHRDTFEVGFLKAGTYAINLVSYTAGAQLDTCMFTNPQDSIHGFEVSANTSVTEYNKSSFAIYPNPSTGLLKTNYKESTEVEIYDAVGNLKRIVSVFNSDNPIEMRGSGQGLFLFYFPELGISKRVLIN